MSTRPPCIPPARRHHATAAGMCGALLALVAAGCTDPGQRCQQHGDCRDDELCADGLCHLACNGSQDCPGQQTCQHGICLPGSLVDASAAERAPGHDAPAPADGSQADALLSDGVVVDGLSPGDARPVDAPARDAAAPELPIVDRVPGDGCDHDVDSGVVCDPRTCPASSEPCLLPTCGPSGCTFTVAAEHTACPDGVCRSGQCEALCWINDATVQPDALLALGGCLACRPQVTPFEYSALDDNDPCDDERWCTGSDRCSGGLCAISEYAGDGRCGDATPHCDEANDRCVQCLSVANCPDDTNVCTTKVCTDGSCGQSNNTASCDDGLWCNGTDTCSLGGCNTHQVTNRCSSVTYRTTCNDALDRCECNNTTCPAGYTCNATSGACRRTVTYNLADINADGLQDPYGNNVDYGWITLSSPLHWGALRYQLANVPRGSAIVAATLSVYVDSVEESAANETIYVEDVASAPALVEGSNFISGRARATTTAIWNQALGTAGRHSTPSVASLIQHVVNRSDWNAGQYLVLILNHRITGPQFEFRQYDHTAGGTDGATLTVTYELP